MMTELRLLLCHSTSNLQIVQKEYIEDVIKLFKESRPYLMQNSSARVLL